MTTPLDAMVRAALGAYGVAPARIARLGGLDTINFEVDAGARGRFVLGLHDPDRHDAVAIASALAWLEHLASDTDLVLPRPVRDLRGERVTTVLDESGRRRACTLTTWVDGDVHAGPLEDRYLEEAGGVMARLHASHFEPPPGFVRPSFDGAHALRCLEVLARAFGDALEPSQMEAIAHGTRTIEALLRALPRDAASYGLIHGDFHAGNYLIHRDRLRVIDFGRCGFAFHALDIAIALEVEAPQREAFLAGYAAVRPLPREFVDHEGTFTAMAHLDNLAFLAPRPQERTFMLDTLPRVAEAFARLTPPA